MHVCDWSKCGLNTLNWTFHHLWGTFDAGVWLVKMWIKRAELNLPSFMRYLWCICVIGKMWIKHIEFNLPSFMGYLWMNFPRFVWYLYYGCIWWFYEGFVIYNILFFEIYYGFVIYSIENHVVVVLSNKPVFVDGVHAFSSMIIICEQVSHFIHILVHFYIISYHNNIICIILCYIAFQYSWCILYCVIFIIL